MLNITHLEKEISKWECGGSLMEIIWKTEGIDQPTIVALMKKRGWKQRKTEEQLNTLRKIKMIRKILSYDHKRRTSTAKCFSTITREEYYRAYVVIY